MSLEFPECKGGDQVSADTMIKESNNIAGNYEDLGDEPAAKRTKFTEFPGWASCSWSGQAVAGQRDSTRDEEIRYNWSKSEVNCKEFMILNQKMLLLDNIKLRETLEERRTIEKQEQMQQIETNQTNLLKRMRDEMKMIIEECDKRVDEIKRSHGKEVMRLNGVIKDLQRFQREGRIREKTLRMELKTLKAKLSSTETMKLQHWRRITELQSNVINLSSVPNKDEKDINTTSSALCSF
ncbi:hypothetical protein DMENIID0001_014210 [Sergentomyia squamirostris]